METPRVESNFVPATAGEVLNLGTIVSYDRALGGCKETCFRARRYTMPDI